MPQKFHQDFSRHTYSMTEVFMHGAARMLEIQAAAAQAIFRAQSRNLAMFGGPDWSPMFERNGQHFIDLVRTSTEQSIALFRQASDAFVEVQQRIGNVVEQQAAQAVASTRRAIDETTQSAGRALEQTRRAGDDVTAEAQRRIDEQARQAREGEPGSLQVEQPERMQPAQGQSGERPEGARTEGRPGNGEGRSQDDARLILPRGEQQRGEQPRSASRKQ